MEYLRVATLNIWNKSGPWPERMASIRRQLGRLGPDIVGLQEVLELESPGRTQCQADEIGEGFEQCYGLGHDMSASWLASDHRLGFGNGILSRFPIREHETLPLPGNDLSDQQRSLLHAVIEAPFGPVDVFVTHLNWKLDEGWVREKQIQRVVELMEERAPDDGRFPPILMGDMNAEPHADEIRFLTGHTRLGRAKSVRLVDVWSYFPELGPGYTFDARQNPYAGDYSEPPRRLDYVFVRGPGPKGRGAPLSAALCFHERVDGIFASDHFGVTADLRI